MKVLIYIIKLDSGDIFQISVIFFTFNMKNDKKMPNTWGNRNTWDNLQFLFIYGQIRRRIL